MPESLDAYAALDQVRRELAKLNERVTDVDGRVERVRVAQLATLAIALSRDSDVPAEVTLRLAGMDYDQIGQLLHKRRDAVRMTIKRYHQRAGRKAGE
jgi:tetrahydromethanopterin S-methyltransferase subunit G